MDSIGFSPGKYETLSTTEAQDRVDKEKWHHRRFVSFGGVLCGLGIALAIALLVYYNSLSGPAPVRSAPGCQHPIYCTGPLLAAVQSSNPPLFNDSKTFVDMPCKSLPAVILADFQLQSQSPNFNLTSFVMEHFLPAGSEVVPATPTDYNPRPPRIDAVQNPLLHSFGFTVNDLWTNLTRRFNTNITCGATCVSSIPQENLFVVPGGRFREFYYWDTFWIIHGLLVSGMLTTARGMLQNFLDMVDTYGFIPNGARIYYLDRSQPPLLTQMVGAYVEASGDVAFLQAALPRLLKEHDFWMQSNHRVQWAGMPAEVVLNRYFVDTDNPRPESYREDVATAASAAPMREAGDVYSNLAAGAESGLDYSTRWFAVGSESISTIDIRNLVPVDLNVILRGNEALIANWTCSGGFAPDSATCSAYQSWASQRTQSIASYLLHSAGSEWLDFDLASMQPRTRSTWYPSNTYPLSMADVVAAMSTLDATAAAQAIQFHVGGVPASNNSLSQQQWDYPNAWAPMQYFAIQSLEAVSARTDNAGLHQAAVALAQSWIDTTYCGFQATGILMEKYNATEIGVAGQGGEYIVQSGFGWTNGLILWILDRYQADLVSPTCNL